MAEIKDPQGTVDAMAAALSAAEQPLLEAMLANGQLTIAIRKFQEAIDTHMVYAPYAEAAEAQGFLGKAFDSLTQCHKRLDALRKVKGLPEPGAQQRNGGGGGKP